MSNKIIVTDISPSVSENTGMEFFGFGGKIQELELVKDDTSDKQIAHITFEKAEGAKTALMLSNAVLEKVPITVKLDESCLSTSEESSESGDGIEQEDKVRAAIFSEILAAGYQLTDVSETVTTKATEINEKYAVQDKVKYAASQVQDTTTRALDTNAGKKMAEFYLNTSKQATDVYHEAIRIANEKKAKSEITVDTTENIQQ
ncbi:3287_t:CDS:2 [Diversispora eburnea]|uniref:3287_t:CDS:1 n=1 Tax=Diversispora eburnea TaxID=1213867 RepID=A0A9N9A4A1_9GLOM|nr:3287_t:CDS:2 [Diversispora eburnea]